MEFSDIDKVLNNTPIGMFERKNTSFKLALFIAMAIAGVCLFMFISLLLMIPLTGINILTDPLALANTHDAKVIDAYKIMQLCNQLGLFVVPAFIAAKLFGGNVLGYLQLNKLPRATVVCATIALMLLALPGINLMGYLNSQMHLPSFMQPIEAWMHAKETEAEQLTKLFLHTNSLLGLLLNVFIVAFMAAFGEELFFRGVLQRILTNKYAKPAIAVWITAIVFSAIHVQFFGFFPRMFIGALLGFLFVWTNNLWIPIIAHFTNNAAAVIMSYATQRGILDSSAEQLGATQNDYILGAVSIVLTLVVLVVFKKLVAPKVQLPVADVVQ